MTKRIGLKNRIRAVGVELEGGWTEVKGINVIHDGSVIIPLPKAPHKPARLQDLPAYERLHAKYLKDYPHYIGEVPSPPLVISEVDDFINNSYPSYTNATCGLHVHMSFFHKMNYQRLLTPDYTTTMIKGLVAWAEKENLPEKHPIWERLKDANHAHCAHVFLGDEQVRQTKKDYNSRGKPHSRYTAINYCFGQHGTVECRLLPMMETAEQASRAVHEVITITNRFLSKIREREKKYTATVTRRNTVLEHFDVVV